MMKNISQYAIFFLLLTFIACTEDRFQPIVEVDIPPHKPRLTIRADWSAGSDSLAVFVSRSRGILDKDKANFNRTYTYWNGKDSIRQVNEYYDTIPNAKVELLRNGQLLGTIPYFNKGYHLAKGLYKLDTISGTIYTIRVSAPNFETVEASQTLQKAFSILRGTVTTNGAVYSDPFDPFSQPEKGDALNMELVDDGADENYYTVESIDNNRWWNGIAIKIERDTLNKTFTSTSYLRNIDPNMDGEFLSDKTFNGRNYVWRFWLNPQLYFSNFSSTTGFRNFQGRLQKGDRVIFRMRSTSKDLVLFEKSLDLARQASDNPFFTEPVILYSNVKNGYGVFSIGSSRNLSILVQ